MSEQPPEPLQPGTPLTPREPPPPPPPMAPAYQGAELQGGYAQPPPVPPGMYFDPASNLVLPQGVQLAGVGRRIGAWFLSIGLFLVTLGIGFVIWGLIAWGRGTSPAFQVLGMKCWVPAEGRRAGFWRMALRDIVGGIVEGILSFITSVVSFILFVANKDHRSLRDLVGGTVVVHDPDKVLG